MKTWATVVGAVPWRCGLCGGAIAVGARVLVITAAGQRWQLRRCVACASGTRIWGAPPAEGEADAGERPS